MVQSSTVLKVVCTLMFLIIAILNLVSILTYWRTVLNQPETAIINGKNVTLASTDIQILLAMAGYKQDDVIGKHGIIKNCKTVLPNGSDKECDLPDGSGFVGDTAIVAMLSLALALYIINILVMLVSMCLRTFPSKALYVLPLTCFLATLFMIGSIIIFVFYYNRQYFPKIDKSTLSHIVNPDAFSLYVFGDDTIAGPATHKISFAKGFYITIVAAVFGLLSICVVCFAALKSADDEKNQNDVEGGYVVEPPHPPQYQYQQQQYAQAPQGHPPQSASSSE